MGLLEKYNDSGLAGSLGMSPRPSIQHQIIMATLIRKLANWLGDNYFVLPETQIDPADPHTLAPDVVVFEKHEDLHRLKPVIFIEIERAARIKKNISKCDEIMKRYGVQESFVFNYETNTWYKILDTTIEPQTESPSYSDLLHVDLDTFL